MDAGACGTWLSGVRLLCHACNPGPCASADGDAADDNKKRIAEAGGISQVIAALHNHTGVGLVQYHGLGALRNLACNGTFIEGVTRVRNGCADITFIWLGVVVCVGIAPCLPTDSNKAEIARLDGIDVVLTAMQSHETHVGIQEQGCAAIANLALDDMNRRAIASKGGIKLVENARNLHPHSNEVQEHSATALKNLRLAV